LKRKLIIGVGAFFAMIAIIAEWMVQFFVVGLDWSRVPFVGPYQNDSPPANSHIAFQDVIKPEFSGR
jgi:hypothetical protein